MLSSPRVVIIGAGIGGLTAAALLLRAGLDVTVLEAHIYPGGSAGTFNHKKYRFDAGATLAGGFSPGGPHARLAEILELDWPVRPVDPAWVVHLPDGRTVTQRTSHRAWRDERRRAFPGKEPFWQRQELLADIAWDISSRPFPWPPRTVADLVALGVAMRPRTLRSLPYLGRTMGDLVSTEDAMFRTFLDGQLLISAQTTAGRAGALYASAALDLPRRGVNHVRGGIGSLATTLVDWIRANGGEVHFRQRAERLEFGTGGASRVHTRQGLSLNADFMIANVTPWSLRELLGTKAPEPLRRDVDRLTPTWGAFTLYLGIDTNSLTSGSADHHQVIVDPSRPLGEGNSVFISLSDADDPSRAPAGMRAATLSTHTRVEPWWRLLEEAGQSAYLEQREQYAARLLTAAERAIPGIGRAVRLRLPGTPVTFQYYTRRPLGMVGGFPQMSIFAARGPATGIDNLWLVGDSIFPGQSTAGVTLGAMRVAAEVVRAAHRLRRHHTRAKLRTSAVLTHESVAANLSD